MATATLEQSKGERKNIPVAKDVWKAAKRAALEREIDLKSFVEQAIREKLAREKKAP